MKDLKEILEHEMKTKNISVEKMASIMGRKRGSYYSGFERKTISIWEFEQLSKYFNIEPNYFFEWETENDTSKRKSAIDTVSDIKEEIDFLRGQIKELTRQNGQLIEILKRG